MKESDDDCLVTYVTRKPIYVRKYHPKIYLYSFLYKGRFV